MLSLQKFEIKKLTASKEQSVDHTIFTLLRHLTLRH